ncbi:glycine rich extracellular protein 1 isoform X2 [Sphaerodactylus townsendi]|uniref:glycine rich extracellular protein 1 isoform X2 n=1 Tax=Sphaerodactylus townsendi TaxID=933632 RepID=UPI002026B3BD|nr:glycine rich extracellular protein 1 isoform X2 [Sphaerodactylus townsendi]
MRSLNLCSTLLLLCLARGSLQGGVKPQGNGRGGPYFPSLIRGVGGVQPGAGLGPAGAKAGKYPGYGGPGGLPAGLGAQNGFGTGPSFMGRPGYGVPAGYGPGLGAYPQPRKQKSGYRGVGYPRVGLPLGGLGARGKPSKAGYGAGPSAYPGAGAQQAYPGGGGAGSYLGNGLQNGYGNGYGAGGNGFPSAGLQPGAYGNGAQAPYGAQLGGPGGDPATSKYAGPGQLPYNGQPQQPETTGLGGEYGNGRYGAPQSPYGGQDGGPGGRSVDPAAVKYGDPSQLPYGAQPTSLGTEGNGNGLGYMNGGDSQTNGLGAGAYGPLAAGQAPGGYGTSLGPGQALGGYGGKVSKYGMNGFLGNGYRGRCPSGKC